MTKTPPEIFFAFLESVKRLQPATLKQLCSDLSTVVKAPNVGAVRSAIAFATSHGFVVSASGGFRLEPLGDRLLRFSGNARIDFLVLSVRLAEKEPFDFLRQQLKDQGTISWERFRKLFQTKFSVTSVSDQTTYAKTYGAWLETLRVAKPDGKGLNYTAGRVEGLEILAVKEAEDLLDRATYDYLTESFQTYHNLLDEPNRLLKTVSTETNDEEKGEAFEKFIAAAFSRLGFSSRTRDGSREQKLNLTFQRKGGGDVGVFCHFPTVAGGKTKSGCAIACEAKATGGAIGSRAVSQARNLKVKIEEVYPNYALHTIVVSGRDALYDSSGRETASPEVLHITDEMLLDVLGMQVKLANQRQMLINPLTIMTGLDELVTAEKREPTRDEFTKTIEGKIRRGDSK